jgi:GT2 family glycosyltransferase
VTLPVTIIVPHFRADVLTECLTSVYAHPPLPARVLVIDDGGNAPSLQRAQAQLPHFEVLRNERNLGFSGSCNRGLEATSTPYAVLLNDDTRVTEGWLEPLLQVAVRDGRVAACQPKLLSAVEPDRFDYGGGAGGYIDRFGFTFCRGRLFSHREVDDGQYDRSVPLFWACGSALFLQMDAARRVGFLDLDYYMHFEEIDLCWRLQLAGYQIVAVPTAVVYHHSGYSLPPQSFRKAYLNHRNNLVMLCKNSAAARLCWLLPLRVGLDLLATAAYVSQRQWSSVAAPAAAALWLVTHPWQLWRRRRRSRSTGVPGARCAGVYAGCLPVQYYLRGVRRARDLHPGIDPP